MAHWPLRLVTNYISYRYKYYETRYLISWSCYHIKQKSTLDWFRLSLVCWNSCKSNGRVQMTVFCNKMSAFIIYRGTVWSRHHATYAKYAINYDSVHSMVFQKPFNIWFEKRLWFCAFWYKSSMFAYLPAFFK